MVYPSTVGAFTMGVVPVDSNCRSPGEMFIDACLTARSGDIEGEIESDVESASATGSTIASEDESEVSNNDHSDNNSDSYASF